MPRPHPNIMPGPWVVRGDLLPEHHGYTSNPFGRLLPPVDLLAKHDDVATVPI
jgi:hypothetical protein